MNSKILTLLFVLILVLVGDLYSQSNEPIKLFNGQDLSGWNGDFENWDVNNGIIALQLHSGWAPAEIHFKDIIFEENPQFLLQTID